MSPTTLTEVYETFRQPKIVTKPWFPIPEHMPDGVKTLFSRSSLAAPQKEDAVQTYMNEKLARLNGVPKATSKAVDTHLTVTLRRRRKPDYSGYVGSLPQTLFSTLWTGDVKELEEKTGGKEDFSKEQKGHAISFLMALLADHPQQPHATGWLSDSVRIVFFRIQRDGEHLTLEESALMYLAREGGLWLVCVLSSFFPSLSRK